MNDKILYGIAQSWAEIEHAAYPLDVLKKWITERNKAVSVEIRKNRLEDSDSWFYDTVEGYIRNKSRSFFSIHGFRYTENGEILEQPIIVQPEIGYLGVLCREINGVVHFLMQAKVEPGNVNKIQLSPTIQATKSNFTQKHGGAKPAYLEYFLEADKRKRVVDQIQSEQSSRFYHKRNRNIIIYTDEEIPESPAHRWMTLGQIKRLMREDNLVNMDTRTVLSCIPYSALALPESELAQLSERFTDKQLFCSTFVGETENRVPQVYGYLNDRKMFSESQSEWAPLYKLRDWEMRDGELVCKKPYPFKVIFCDISIEGREVRHWTQPLFEAIGIATFGLICCEDDNVLKFLVKAKPEVGCFDVLELGPTVQREAVSDESQDIIEAFFFDKLVSGNDVVFDHLLSEEGGRFYHEQNRNVLLRVNAKELPPLPPGYFLLDYRTLNTLVQINNTLNIQLRNLLSLLEA